MFPSSLRSQKVTTPMSDNKNNTKGDDSTTASPDIVKESSTADMKDGSSGNKMATFRLILLIFMVLQNSSTVLVGRHTRSSVPEDQLYVVNHLILITEVGKCLLSCVFEHFSTGGRLWESIQQNILARPMDALKISVPALLYLVQNSLLYTALSNLSAPLFQVTYQCKLVTTALVSVLMLDRKYSSKQWICLVVLSVGVAIVVLGESSSDKKQEIKEDAPAQSLVKGLVAVSIACMSSALAGVYFEKVLKKPASAEQGQAPPVSVWMRNMQLAFFSMIIAVVQGAMQGNSSEDEEPKPYFYGFTFWVWILVGLQAGGGLLVAAVIKYADNVLKGLATGVSVVVATACSTLLFGTMLSGQFLFGASMILTSVYLFSNNVPAFCTKNSSAVEMKPLVLPK